MVIFDFDLTLVDTGPVQKLRAAKKWRDVMARVPELKVYDGVHELLHDLEARHQRLAIVTNSPDMVPRAFIERYDWPIDIVLGYHQVRRRKPAPEALLTAMRRADAAPESSFHVGDQPQDTEAARAANVTAIGAGWGLENTAALQKSQPDCLFLSVDELWRYFRAVV